MKSSFVFKLSVFYVFIFILTVGFVFIFFSQSINENHVDEALRSVSLSHFFGTDSLGRDLFARTMTGAFSSLLIGMSCSVVAMVIGVIYGGFSALVGGWLDQIMMRFMEILIATPQMITMGLVLLYFSSRGTSSIPSLIIAISLSTWTSFARLTRNLSLREKKLPYVEATIAIGARPAHIFFKSILPNLLPSILVLLGLQLPNFLLFESFLSFVGVGVRSPDASWGILLQEGWRTMSVYPHLLIFPALILFMTVFSLNVIFDQYRNSLLRKFEAIDLHY